MERGEPFPYRIEVLYDREDQCYVARVQSLPGCVAHGDSPEAAAAQVRVAALTMIAVMQQHGDRIPPPDWNRANTGAPR